MLNKKATKLIAVSAMSLLTLNGMSITSEAMKIENGNECTGTVDTEYEQGVEPYDLVSRETPKDVSGVRYYGRTQVATIVGENAISSATRVRANKIVKAGRMGGHTAIYREGTGTAVASSSWKYNSTSASTHYTRLSYTKPSKGQNFRAKGTMQLYEESTGKYVGVTLIPSPFVMYKSMNLTISDEELQERTMMYDTKKMIAAEGLNGEIGYISIDDMGLTENPNSPEEALALQEERLRKYGEYQDINLYDKDGKTVIGKFRVYNT